jgi:hypothetical protein
MECPRCKRVFSTVQQILMTADRSFYCDHCWCRLIYYPERTDGCQVEEDVTGEKWFGVRKVWLASPR